jgi:ATP-dependent Zn protease
MPDDLTPTFDPLATATHEAGHAVVAWALGVRVLHASIGHSQDDALGRVRYPDDAIICQDWCTRGRRRTSLRKCALANVVIMMAGRIAEESFRPQVPTSHLTIGASGDKYEVKRRLLGLFETVARARIAEGHLQDFAERLVLRHHERIERLAAALIQRRTLGPRQIVSLLR